MTVICCDQADIYPAFHSRSSNRVNELKKNHKALCIVWQYAFYSHFVLPFPPNSLREMSSRLITRCTLPSMSFGMTMFLSSCNLILLMVAENMIMLFRRAVLSLFMTRNRVVDKEMYLVMLALDLFWDDNVTASSSLPPWSCSR
jgi:hypothetical protein